MQFETRAQLTQAPQQSVRSAFNYRGPSQALKSLQQPAAQRCTHRMIDLLRTDLCLKKVFTDLS